MKKYLKRTRVVKIEIIIDQSEKGIICLLSNKNETIVHLNIEAIAATHAAELLNIQPIILTPKNTQ